MKTFPRLLLLIALVTSSFLAPLTTVSAAPQPAPKPEDAPANSVWHCLEVFAGVCPEDSNPLVFEGTEQCTEGGDVCTVYNQMYGKMVCDLVGCSTDVPVFINITFTYTWTAIDWAGAPWMDDDGPRVVITVNGATAATYPCGAKTDWEGSCTGNFYIRVQSLSLDPGASFHAWASVGGYGPVKGGQTLDFSISISGEPTVCAYDDAPECLATAVVIDPTKESYSDVLKYTIESGKTYRMKLAGSWQNDGTPPDLIDLEVSFDEGATWESPLLMLDIIQCVQLDPESTDLIIFFTAPSNNFAIRVKDEPGQYADNTGGMTLDLCEATPRVTQDCSGQFTVGSTVVATGTIPANVSSYSTSVGGTEQWLEIGKWYVLTTSGGPWYDGGAGDPRYDIQMKEFATANWQTPDAYAFSNCYETGGNYVSVYFQGSETQRLYLRVNDTGGVFNTNTGSVDYTITVVDNYEAYPEGCALTFAKTTFIEERKASAQNAAGVQLLEVSNFELPLWPVGGEANPKIDRYFVLETEGIWNNDGNSMVAGQMKKDTDPWAYIPSWDEAVCVQELDPIGHVRVFFDATKKGTWKFGVYDPDNNILNNSGSLGYKLYYAVNFEIPSVDELPVDGYCDKYYSREPSGTTITLYGSASTGVTLPVITPNTIVAIQVSEGPWKNDGTDSYATAISDDNGATYTEILAYTGIVCKQQSPDANHPLLYLYGRSGKNYKVRVYDPGGDYGDNTLSIKMIVYPATALDTVDTWQQCSQDYDTTEVALSDEERTIGAALLDGKAITAITPGKEYALEVSGEGLGWGLGSFSAFVSNGGTWEPTPNASWATCAVALTYEDDPVKNRYRIYFTSEAGKTYRMKAGTLIVSTGWIRYRLYETTSSVDPLPPEIWIQPIPDEWGGCNVSCMRPSGAFTYAGFSLGSFDFGSLGEVQFPTVTLPVPNVGGWVNYARCSLVVYFSWCDIHTAALEKIFTVTTTKEPFGTIDELSQTFTMIRNDLRTLSSTGGTDAGLAPSSLWGGGTGGEAGGLNIFGDLMSDNPLMGGQFDFTGASNNVPGVGGTGDPIVAYELTCNALMHDKIGPGASQTFCWLLGFIHSKNWGVDLLTMLQYLFDIGMLVALIGYVMTKWIGQGGVPN
jgi:hypothetical protein